MKQPIALMMAFIVLLSLTGMTLATQQTPSFPSTLPALQPTSIPDQTPPSTELALSGPTHTADEVVWVSSTTLHTLTAEDNVDPPDEIETFFRFHRAAVSPAPFQAYAEPFTLTGIDGRYWIQYFSRDRAGNEEPTQLKIEHLDNAPPQAIWQAGTPIHYDDLGRTWITSDTRHTLAAEDPDAPDRTPGSGLDTILYQVYQVTDEGPTASFTVYDTPFIIAGPDAEYAIDFFALDNLGNSSQIRPIRVFLDNTAPFVDIDGPYTGSEGSVVAFNAGASQDAGAGIAEIAWDLNSDHVFDDATGLTAQRTWADDGSYTLSVQITDHLGNSASASAPVQINNVAPTAQIGGLVPEQPWPGELVTLNAVFSDPGWLDTHTATVAWGDGSTSSANVIETNEPPQATGTITAQHVYTLPGTYTVRLIVTDDDIGTTEVTAEVRVQLSPQMPGVLSTQNLNNFLNWTASLPGTLGSAQWQWRVGAGIADFWWIQESQGWLYFFLKTQNDIPTYDPTRPVQVHRNFLAIAVPTYDFQLWFWCGFHIEDELGRDAGFGCHPQFGPPPEGAGILHPWVQERLQESAQHIVNILHALLPLE